MELQCGLYIIWFQSVADLGGGADPSLLTDSTPCRSKGPLRTFLKYPYLVTDPKIVHKAPLVPISSNFKGGERAKRTQFFGRNFPKIA